MLYYLIRRRNDKEPLALLRFNAKEEGNMFLGIVSESRFGAYVKVDRSGQHVYNILLGDHQDVIDALDYKARSDSKNALKHGTNYRLEQVEQAEWETFEAFALFPILKVGMAR
jgi:hypothetical protein